MIYDDCNREGDGGLKMEAVDDRVIRLQLRHSGSRSLLVG